MWEMILACKLLQHDDIVRGIHKRHKPSLRIEVDFKTGIKEIFHCDGKDHRITAHSFSVYPTSLLDSPVPIYQQYESRPFSDDEQLSAHHQVIHRADWTKHTIPEQRISYHKFLAKLIETKDFEDHYPFTQRKSDLLAVRRDKPERYMRRGSFYLYPAGTNINTPWRRLVEHFFQIIPSLTEEALDKALTKVCKKKIIDINTYEVRKRAAYCRAYNPTSYRAILERLSVKGPVIDLHPDIGHKAIACAMLGIKYICPKTEKFMQAVDKGFVNEIGLDHEWLTDQKAHTIISDNNFAGLDIEQALPMADRCNMLIACSNTDERIGATESYSPSRTYVVRKSRYRPPAFLLVW